MAIIALVAVGLGVRIELNNHIQRDRIIKKMLMQYRDESTYTMRALECQRAHDSKLPYHPFERLKLVSSLPGIRGALPYAGFGSWEAESDYHLY
jgi:hypothetical protein